MGNEHWYDDYLLLALRLKSALGTYKPQIHTHYLPHLSLSFARHTISLNTTFILLSTDYSKSLHLQSDRSLELHTPLGCHYTTRLPRYGRDLRYDRRSAEALIPAVGVNENGSGEVFRLNLEVGRYLRAYEVDVGGDDFASTGGGALQGGIRTGSVNVAAVADTTHNLLAFGTSQGTVEFWDPRSRHRIGLLQAPAVVNSFEGHEEITALEFDHTGLGIACGTSAGLIRLYDLRSPNPILKKDQGYGYPIQTIIHLNSSSSTRAQTSEPKILSADKRIIKIWDARDGSPWTSVEPAVDIHSVAWHKDSGMLLTANEGRQQHSFFIPQLGPAPKWCAFLDNLVEEMAEDPEDPKAFTSQRAGSIYDNYKFLTPAQLESLNLSHLIGTTSLLRPYMHGYFVAQRLYEEAKLIADPFVWEEDRSKRVKEKVEAERESRIRGTKKITTKVNQHLAEKLMEQEEREEQRRARRIVERGADERTMNGADTEVVTERRNGRLRDQTNLLSDSRFSKLFEDEAYAIDESSREFQLLNPSTKPIHHTVRDDVEPKLTAVEQEELTQLSSSDAHDSVSEAEDKTARRSQGQHISSASYSKNGHRSHLSQMQVSSSKKSKTRDHTFGSRKQKMKQTKESYATLGGEREITFVPNGVSKKPPGSQAASSQRKKDSGRRSASGNVFRKM